MLAWKRRPSTPEISTFNSTTRKPTPVFQPTYACTLNNEKQDSQFASSVRRAYANSQASSSSLQRKSFGGFPSMSTGSLTGILPKTPSPICSDGSTTNGESGSSSPGSDYFYSEVGTEFSSPPARAQSVRSVSARSKLSSRFCGNLNQADRATYPTEREAMKQHVDLKSCMAMSSAYGSVLDEMEEEDHSPRRHSAEETDYPSPRDHIRFDYESPIDRELRLRCRMKPYNEFLNEVNRQEAEAQVDAENKAKETKLMKKLKRKEDAINDWELRKTAKAIKKKNLLEKKLDRKISNIKREANNKKERARRIVEGQESTATRITEKFWSIKESIMSKLFWWSID